MCCVDLTMPLRMSQYDPWMWNGCSISCNYLFRNVTEEIGWWPPQDLETPSEDHCNVASILSITNQLLSWNYIIFVLLKYFRIVFIAILCHCSSAWVESLLFLELIFFFLFCSFSLFFLFSRKAVTKKPCSGISYISQTRLELTETSLPLLPEWCACLVYLRLINWLIDYWLICVRGSVWVFIACRLKCGWGLER